MTGVSRYNLGDGSLFAFLRSPLKFAGVIQLDVTLIFVTVNVLLRRAVEIVRLNDILEGSSDSKGTFDRT